MNAFLKYTLNEGVMGTVNLLTKSIFKSLWPIFGRDGIIDDEIIQNIQLDLNKISTPPKVDELRIALIKVDKSTIKTDIQIGGGAGFDNNDNLLLIIIINISTYIDIKNIERTHNKIFNSVVHELKHIDDISNSRRNNTPIDMPRGVAGTNNVNTLRNYLLNDGEIRAFTYEAYRRFKKNKFNTPYKSILNSILDEIADHSNIDDNIKNEIKNEVVIKWLNYANKHYELPND